MTVTRVMQRSTGAGTFNGSGSPRQTPPTAKSASVDLLAAAYEDLIVEIIRTQVELGRPFSARQERLHKV